MAKQLAADGLLARSVHAHCNTELAVQSGRALLERAKEYNFFAAHAHPPDPHGKRRRLSSGDAEEEDHTVDLVRTCMKNVCVLAQWSRSTFIYAARTVQRHR
jgi:hypothetical protein